FIPVDICMQRLDKIIEKYNVGFLYAADENFGTDKRWLEEFCEQIKKRDILFAVGTRAKGVTPDSLRMLREAGCTDVTYGNETGSERMLEIMEKKVSIEDNYNAVKWAIEAGMNSIVQLVCGMPGETPETIAETIEFTKYCNTVSPNQNPNDLSVNYAQALPGTPLYEHARENGLIGKTLEEEEKYLLAISDRDAHDETTTLNFTDYPKLTCETWRPLITIEVNYHYVKRFGIDQYFKVIARDTDYFHRPANDTGYYANPKRLLDTLSFGKKASQKDRLVPPSLFSLVIRRQYGLAIMMYPVMAYRFRKMLPFLVFIKNIKIKGIKYSLGVVAEYFSFMFAKKSSLFNSKDDYKSLRKIVKIAGDVDNDDNSMLALRKGR
ncbi:MAG: hypothetical protein CFH08_00714, partial [Alphaproteobacteria bacterium MarineAlpha3_Bin7]